MTHQKARKKTFTSLHQFYGKIRVGKMWGAKNDKMLVGFDLSTQKHVSSQRILRMTSWKKLISLAKNLLSL